jgi:hypothetical protein
MKQEEFDPDDEVRIFGLGDSGNAQHGAFLHMVQNPETGSYLEPRWFTPQDAELDAMFADLPKPAHDFDDFWAVVDTGVMHNHPRLKDNITFEVDFTGEGPEDLSGHGTVCALLLLGWGSDRSLRRLINLKIATADGRGKPEWLAKALDWLADFALEHQNGVVTANLSIGVYRKSRWLGRDCAGQCDVCQAAVRASAAGVFLSVAAGNTPGRTACPGSVGLTDRGKGILVATTDAAGIGSLTQPEGAHLVSIDLDREENEDAISRAEKAWLDDDVVAAEAIYQGLVSQGREPAASRAHLMLGVMRYFEGAVDKAQDKLVEATHSTETDIRATAHFWLALLWAHTDDRPRVIGALEASLENSEDWEWRAPASLLLAFYAILEGDRSRAVSLLRSASAEGNAPMDATVSIWLDTLGGDAESELEIETGAVARAYYALGLAFHELDPGSPAVTVYVSKGAGGLEPELANHAYGLLSTLARKRGDKAAEELFRRKANEAAATWFATSSPDFQDISHGDDNLTT